MSDRTNDEKLRILQERLSQIKQKSETSSATSKEEKEEIIEVASPQTKVPRKEKDPISFKWLKYFILYFLCGFGGYYAYNNIDFTNTFASDIKIEETKEFVLEYNLNMPGEKIAITGSFENENSAKAMVKELNVKGFKSDYFFLPNKSNSKEEVYKVFIGPYENGEETNQWIQNIEGDFEIVSLK